MGTMGSEDKRRGIFGKISWGFRVKADGWEINLHFKDGPAH